MSGGPNYVVLGYVLGLALLWGYAASLWLSSRAARRRIAEDEVEKEKVSS